MEKGILRRKMKRSLMVVLCLLMFTSTASAQTMYLKDVAWSHQSKEIEASNRIAIYGEGEAVEVINTLTWNRTEWSAKSKCYVLSEKKSHKVCEVEKNGKKAYIPMSSLTTKKPKVSYTIKNCYRKLTIRDGGAVRVNSPSGRKINLDEWLTVYTIGRTNYWYEFYHKGRLYFIQKNSADIVMNEESTFPRIELDGVLSSCIDRVKYQYSLVPQYFRDYYAPNSFTVSNWKNQDTGKAGYIYLTSKNIWLRENKYISLENSVLHEIGHIYFQYSGVPTELYYDTDETDRLRMGDYYYKEREFFAEGFEFYIRQYETVKKKAAKLFKYLEDRRNKK